jgi:hypothetical protein
LDLTLSLDPETVRIASLETTSVTSEFTAIGNARDGTYEVSLFGARAVQSDGPLLILRFDADAGAEARRLPVSIVAAQANEGRIRVAVGPANDERKPNGTRREVDR